IRILGVAAARRFVQSRKDSGQGSARGRARCPSEQLVPATPRPIAEPRRCRRGTRDERPKEHVVPASISAELPAHTHRGVGAGPDRGVSARTGGADSGCGAGGRTPTRWFRSHSTAYADARACHESDARYRGLPPRSLAHRLRVAAAPIAYGFDSELRPRGLRMGGCTATKGRTGEAAGRRVSARAVRRTGAHGCDPARPRTVGPGTRAVAHGPPFRSRPAGRGVSRGGPIGSAHRGSARTGGRASRRPALGYRTPAGALSNPDRARRTTGV